MRWRDRWRAWRRMPNAEERKAIAFAAGYMSHKALANDEMRLHYSWLVHYLKRTGPAAGAGEVPPSHARS